MCCPFWSMITFCHVTIMLLLIFHFSTNAKRKLPIKKLFLLIDSWIANYHITKCVLLDYASKPKNSTETIYDWNPQLLSCQLNIWEKLLCIRFPCSKKKKDVEEKVSYFVQDVAFDWRNKEGYSIAINHLFCIRMIENRSQWLRGLTD